MPFTSSCAEDYYNFQFEKGDKSIPTEKNTIKHMAIIDGLCSYIIQQKEQSELATKIQADYGKFLDTIYAHHALLQSFLESDAKDATSSCVKNIFAITLSDPKIANYVRDEKEFKFVERKGEKLQIVTKSTMVMTFNKYMSHLSSSVIAVRDKLITDIPDDVKKGFYNSMKSDRSFTHGPSSFGSELCARFDMEADIIVKDVATYVKSLNIEGLTKAEITSVDESQNLNENVGQTSTSHLISQPNHDSNTMKLLVAAQQIN